MDRENRCPQALRKTFSGSSKRMRSYAVAGLIGLEEILKRLDKHETELVELRKEAVELREDMIAGFKRNDEEIAKLRENMNRGFELLTRHLSAIGASGNYGSPLSGKCRGVIWRSS